MLSISAVLYGLPVFLQFMMLFSEYHMVDIPQNLPWTLVVGTIIWLLVYFAHLFCLPGLQDYIEIMKGLKNKVKIQRPKQQKVRTVDPELKGLEYEPSNDFGEDELFNMNRGNGGDLNSMNKLNNDQVDKMNVW